MLRRMRSGPGEIVTTLLSLAMAVRGTCIQFVFKICPYLVFVYDKPSSSLDLSIWRIVDQTTNMKLEASNAVRLNKETVE